MYTDLYTYVGMHVRIGMHIYMIYTYTANSDMVAQNLEIFL